MIDEVLAFLEGRTADVRDTLRTMMQVAAERTDFERARDLRDALKLARPARRRRPRWSPSAAATRT